MNKSAIRREKIVELIDKRGFASVKELSRILQVSEMTIRRDLTVLAGKSRIARTFGGGAPIVSTSDQDESSKQPGGDSTSFDDLIQESDVLITTTYNPKYAPLIFGNDGKIKFPIVAESTPLKDSLTCIGVDNYSAGFDLGKWAGNYALEKFSGKANVLDLTYHFPNTEDRSRGFRDGLAETIPTIESFTSVNPESRMDFAYQLTQDALEVNDQINMIFAINDTNAWGAIQACLDLNIDPDKLLVISFGLEGDNIKNALRESSYCKIALAMFPEIVGRTCVDAAIQVYRFGTLPEIIKTPYRVLTKESLSEFYTDKKTNWELRWESVSKKLNIPNILDVSQLGSDLPNAIGVLIPFPEHEWYQNMVKEMEAYARECQTKLVVLDAELSLKDEMEFRKREIARRAAQEISPGDTVLIDGGVVTSHLAEFINKKTEITVITNSTEIFDVLEDNPGITLISTGGVYRRNSKALVGPTAEAFLQDIRVDKLFLTVSGVSFDFGLSYTNTSEVTIKQAMIRSAREVILLAEHTKFEQESFTLIAPIDVVDILITDNGLPASSRLELNKAGVDVIISQT